jgi:hypothetical protein
MAAAASLARGPNGWLIGKLSNNSRGSQYLFPGSSLQSSEAPEGIILIDLALLLQLPTSTQCREGLQIGSTGNA